MIAVVAIFVEHARPVAAKKTSVDRSILSGINAMVIGKIAGTREERNKELKLVLSSGAGRSY